MSDRLADVFARCSAEGRAALIGYLPVGFPDPARSRELLRVLVENGCDIVELGIPYSDPVMDGPTIQAAADTALAAGARVRDVFTAAEVVADAGGSPVVMSYWNPVLRYGIDAFARDLPRPAARGSSPRTSSPTRRTSGSPHPTHTASTASSWSRRRRPRSVWP